MKKIFQGLLTQINFEKKFVFCVFRFIFNLFDFEQNNKISKKEMEIGVSTIVSALIAEHIVCWFYGNFYWFFQIRCVVPNRCRAFNDTRFIHSNVSAMIFFFLKLL